MAPEHPDTSDNPEEREPVLDEAQDRRVRRLLADARHTDPIPTEIAARLEQVLIDLAEQPEVPTERQTPVELASRRRRRVTSMLVAAAAVVVVGIGLGQLVGTQTSSPEASRGAGDSAAGAAEALPGTTSLKGSSQDFAPLDPVTIREDSFAGDVERARRKLTALRSTLSSSEAGSSTPLDSTDKLDRAAFDCILEEWGTGTFVAVRYDGDPGVLVFRAGSSDTQVVDLYGCGSPEVLRSITLPAP